MPTFLLPQPIAIADFGVDTHDAPWLGDRAADRLTSEAATAGLTLGESADRVTVSSGAVATTAAFKAFLEASDPFPGDVIGVPDGPAARWAKDPAFGAEALLFRWRGAGPVSDARKAAARRVPVPLPPAAPIEVRVADVAGGRSEQLPASDALVVPIGHWAGLLWANLLALRPTLVGQVTRPWWTLPLRTLGAVIATGSGDPFLLLGRFNRVERGALVHPSAVIEGSWIRAGARIGPGAVVTGSIIGEGASVEPQALVRFSVVAANAHVQRQGFVLYALICSGGAVGGTAQLSVIGPGASVKRGATLLDQPFGRAARVRVGDQLHDVPLGALGVGVGARTVVGSGVQVAPGRTIPPDLQIADAADRVLLKIPAQLTGPVQVQGGSLVKTS